MDGLEWKTLLNMDDLGVPPLFQETSMNHIQSVYDDEQVDGVALAFSLKFQVPPWK